MTWKRKIWYPRRITIYSSSEYVEQFARFRREWAATSDWVYWVLLKKWVALVPMQTWLLHYLRLLKSHVTLNRGWNALFAKFFTFLLCFIQIIRRGCFSGYFMKLYEYWHRIMRLHQIGQWIVSGYEAIRYGKDGNGLQQCGPYL